MKWLLPALFIVYYSSISLFMHVHYRYCHKAWVILLPCLAHASVTGQKYTGDITVGCHIAVNHKLRGYLPIYFDGMYL